MYQIESKRDGEWRLIEVQGNQELAIEHAKKAAEDLGCKVRVRKKNGAEIIVAEPE